MEDPNPPQQDKQVGYGFRPTDEELVSHYLRRKLLGDDVSIYKTIPEIDICKHEPWDLPEFSPIKSDDPEWFFFGPIAYKYSNSTKSKRATSHGYWKATGKDRKIRDPVTNNVIGTKKTLVFYQRRFPRIKNNWVIHENERTHFLCKLLKKPEKIIKEKTDELVCDKSQPDDRIAVEVEYENQAKLETPLESNGSIGCSRIQSSSEVNSTD